MQHLHFKSCPANPDIWIWPAQNGDGSLCYDYVLLYIDDTLVISENAEGILRDELGCYFQLKQVSIGPPQIYLGGLVWKVTPENGMSTWSFSASQYVQAAIKNVEAYICNNATGQLKLPAKTEMPLRGTYRPELDLLPELGHEDVSYYQSLITILCWIIEFGQVDMCLEVSKMSSHLALPHEGYLDQVLQIVVYLKKYHNTKMVYDPSDPTINYAEFERRGWASLEFGHIDGKEELPPKMPEPHGMGFTIHAKVDAYHASDMVTRCLRTGFLVYINSALVYWWSKKQASIESSSFGLEFISMKQCCEYICSLRYKLQMMGIPCDEPAFIYGDNQSVLANTTIPDSTLKKKSQSITYHFIREGVACIEWRMTYVNTHENEADLLTNILPSGEKQKGFVMNLLHHIF